MSTTRLSLDAAVTCDELVARSHSGPIVEGRSSWPFARQTRGDVTRSLNEYATCYISCCTINARNAKWPHVGVFGALGQVLARIVESPTWLPS
eukprot:3719906-Pleurochrysis_carterae.AAC.3